MKVRIWQALLTLALVLATPMISWTQGSGDDYIPSDPARVGKTGRPQLVEFFHPL